MHNLAAYGITPSNEEMQYYENVFVRILKTVLPDIPRYSAEYHNAQLILNNHANRPGVKMESRADTMPDWELYDSLAARVSQNALNQVLHNRFQFQYFPRLTMSVTCAELPRLIPRDRVMRMPAHETAADAQVKIITALLVKNFRAPAGYTYVGQVASPSEVVQAVVQSEVDKYNQHLVERRIDGDLPSVSVLQSIRTYAADNGLDTKSLDDFMDKVRTLVSANTRFYKDWQGFVQGQRLVQIEYNDLLQKLFQQ